ncbi:MAG: hypothetical protein JWR35_713 [Marmoricola sp.]|nr:hypothetical protein [Marmoricola sp.]
MRRRHVLPVLAALVAAAAFSTPAYAQPSQATVQLAHSTFYPVVDNYLDTLGITVTHPDSAWTSEQVDIVASGGATVRSFPPVSDNSQLSQQFSWNGQDNGGAAEPAGSYTVRVTVSDDSPNPSMTTSSPFTLSTKQLVTKPWSRTVSASGSLARKFVGKCSTVRKPSLRGWSGSIGLYSNTKCKGKTFQTSHVESLHTVRLPAAISYKTLSVSTYGGAAKSNKRSFAYIDYLTTNGVYTASHRLGSGVTQHAGLTRATTPFVFSDHSIGWLVYTAMGARYDVKNFTVHLSYTVLQ